MVPSSLRPWMRGKKPAIESGRACHTLNKKSMPAAGAKMSSSQMKTACVLSPLIGLNRLLSVSESIMRMATRPPATRSLMSCGTGTFGECHVMKTV